MTHQLCAATSCYLPGQHLPDCPDSTTHRGCLPNTAGAGLHLCYNHADGIGHDATTAAHLWTELATSLTAHGPAERRTSNPHPSLNLNPAVVEVRSAIRSHLVAWVHYIADGRRLQLPWRWQLLRLPAGVEGPNQRVRTIAHNNTALAAYITGHGRWLAAQPDAGTAADGFAHLVGRARGLIDGPSTRKVQIGPCPMAGCSGTLQGLIRPKRSHLLSVVACDTDDAHTWTSDSWITLRQAMRTP